MRTNTGKIVSLVLVLALTLAFSGCTRAVGLSAEELVEEVLRAQYEMETIRYEMEMTSTSEMEFDGEAVTTTMDITGSGAVDFVNEKMKMAMNTSMSMPLEDGMIQESEMQMYFLDGMMYMKTTVPGVPAMWMKMESPIGVQPIPVEQTIRLLKASEVEILRIEEINGTSCYAIKVIPDMKVLFEIMMQQMGEMTAELPEEAAEEMYPPEGMEEMFENVEIRQWIARDTFLPVKETMEMTMTFNGMTSETTTTTTYYAHNEPVSIELPSGAADAKDFSAMIDDMALDPPPPPTFATFEDFMEGLVIPADVTDADMERLRELYDKAASLADPEDDEAWDYFFQLMDELGIR